MECLAEIQNNQTAVSEDLKNELISLKQWMMNEKNTPEHKIPEWQLNE